MTDDQTIPHVMPREKWRRMQIESVPFVRVQLRPPTAAELSQFEKLSRALTASKNSQQK